jgi:hypothetical protein
MQAIQGMVQSAPQGAAGAVGEGAEAGQHAEPDQKDDDPDRRKDEDEDRHDPNHPLVPDQKSDNSGAAPGQTARQGRAPEPPRQERAEPAQTRPQQSPL